MKKGFRMLMSGVVLLTLLFGILLGKLFFSSKDEDKQIASSVEKTEVEKEEDKKSEAGTEKSTQQDPKGSIEIYDIEDGYMQVPHLPELAHHTYQWSNLHEEGGFNYYIDEGGARSKIGIDVSYFQESIDWERVKASGIEFVMLRMGYRGYGGDGALVVDEKFHQYITEAQAAGLDTGIYFFSQAISQQEALEEAAFVYRECKEYELKYPVVFDTEKIKGEAARTDGLTPAELTDITKAFCSRIKQYGYEPMIYANAKWLTTKLELERLKEYKVWYADYQREPLYPYDFTMWQYTEEGKVDGIEGNVDLNIWFPE